MNDEELEAAISRAHNNLMQIKRMHEEAEKPFVKVLVDLMSLRRTSNVVFVDGKAQRMVQIAMSEGGEHANQA